MEAIQKENYTSNVVDLMVSMLRYLFTLVSFLFHRTLGLLPSSLILYYVIFQFSHLTLICTKETPSSCSALGRWCSKYRQSSRAMAAGCSMQYFWEWSHKYFECCCKVITTSPSYYCNIFSILISNWLLYQVRDTLFPAMTNSYAKL